MAQPPESGRLRHVGRVVDPSVREDGEPEPELTLEPEPDASGAQGPSSDEAPATTPRSEARELESEPALAPGSVARGASMRERLLSRAHRLREEQELEGAAVQGDLDEIGKDSSRDGVRESPRDNLRAPGTPLAPARARLSPTLVVLFGTAMGIAVVVSLCAVAVHLLPRDGTPLLEPAPPPVTSAAPVEAPRVVLVKKPERKKEPGPWRIKDGASDAGVRLVEGKIGTDAFLKAVTGAGVKEKEAYRLLAAFKDIRSFDKCNKLDRFSALIDRASSRIKAFEYMVGPEEVYQAREGADGLLKALKLDLKVERGKVTGSLLYDGSSFEASAERAGFDPGLSKVVSKALEGHFSLEELEAGDVVRVVAQEVAVLGEFARYSGVEAVELRRQGKEQPFRVYFFDAAGERGYYDAQGRAPYEGGWRKPIPNAPITSPFNLKRMHPVLKVTKPHLGTDFGSPTGTPIGASSFGTIVFIGYAGPTGNFVKIEHPGGISTGYAHMSRFEPGLKVGDKVKRLQTIGYVGSTGRSTGPHLHFSAQKDGEFFDPMKLNLDAMRTVSKEQRAAFEAVVAKYNAELDAIPLPPEPPRAASPAPAASGAAPAGAVGDPGDEEGDGDEIAAGTPAAPAPPPAAPAPAAPAAAAPAAAAKPGKSSIYLTDKELMEMQGRGDDGEVAE